MKIKLLHCFVLTFGLALAACNSTSQPKALESNSTPTTPPVNGFTRIRYLSPAAKLRKLSLHLKGGLPSSEEYQALQSAINEGVTSDFFSSKAREYLSSEQHVGKMVQRLDSLFRVRSSLLPPEMAFRPLPTDGLPQQGTDLLNSMDLIFARIAKENLSWDTLLTGREYQIYYPIVRYSLISDLGFFNLVKPSLPPSEDGAIRTIDPNANSTSQESLKELQIQFDQDDPRIAGAVTTSRFFARYGNTNVNKNRRRAAAIFRIFLCDDMKPILPSGNDDLSELLNNAFPIEGQSNETHATLDDEKRHGTDPACMACHYKLDPMGKTFQTIATVLSTSPSPGALIYRREDGSLVNIDARGFGDIAKAITRQNEYSSCQVRHFWDWFIGKDVVLTKERHEELTRIFNQLNRKANDFIAYLMEQPEFSEARSATFSPDVTFNQVKPIFKQCSTCHSGLDSRKIPDFASLPIGGSDRSNRKWISRIAEKVDLANRGEHPTMPPAKSGWKLSVQDVSDIYNWVKNGAQDELAKRTLDEDTVRKILTPEGASR